VRITIFKERRKKKSETHSRFSQSGCRFVNDCIGLIVGHKRLMKHDSFSSLISSKQDISREILRSHCVKYLRVSHLFSLKRPKKYLKTNSASLIFSHDGSSKPKKYLRAQIGHDLD
jgi:hypothetical protein